MTRGQMAFALLAVLASLLFVRLGFWQLGRHAEVRDANAARDARLALPAVPIATLLDSPPPIPEDSVAWRRVELAGSWQFPREVLIRNRGLGGRPGVQVVTPLAVDWSNGDVSYRLEVLVLRGWLPAADATDPGPVPATDPTLPASAGRIGVLRPSREGAGGPVVGVGEGDEARPTFAAVDVGAIQRTIEDRSRPMDSVTYLPFFVQLLPDGGSATTAAGPVPMPLPEPGNGPHLAYAVQWFAFAAVTLVGTWALLFRRRRVRAGRTPD